MSLSPHVFKSARPKKELSMSWTNMVAHSGEAVCVYCGAVFGEPPLEGCQIRTVQERLQGGLTQVPDYDKDYMYWTWGGGEQ